jgi:hypothetical protein
LREIKPIERREPPPGVSRTEPPHCAGTHISYNAILVQERKEDAKMKRERRSFALSSLPSDEPIILVMRSDPNPSKVLAIWNG